jgi:hypothetical protein
VIISSIALEAFGDRNIDQALIEMRKEEKSGGDVHLNGGHDRKRRW